MAALNFPNSPSNGDTYSANGSTFTYNGTAWEKSDPGFVTVSNNTNNRVVTATGGSNLNGEANLTFDGSTLDVTGEVQCTSLDVNGTANISGTTVFQGDVGIGNTTPGNSFDNGKSLALGDNDTGIRQNGDGVLELWSNNAQCFRVNNTGNLSYKTLSPSSNNSLDLGTTSLRWRNLYINDLQLSNEARKDEGGNDVDGTWGNYTIQEGETNLYLINNRNGKKYKFNLTEVD